MDSKTSFPVRAGIPISLAPLTSIRFFAAMYVILYHTYPERQSVFGRFVDIGNISVGVFFVLSGFILTYVYCDKLDSPRRWSSFFLSRFARIYPVFLLSLLTDIPRLFLWRLAKYGLGLAFGGTALTFGLQAAMLQAWGPWGALNFPSWSLSTEAAFYAAFPLLLPRCAALVDRIGVWPAIALCWIAILAVPICVSGLSLPIATEDLLAHNPILRLPEFVAGICLSIRFIRRQALRSRTAAWTPPAALVGAALMLTAVILAKDHLPSLVIENGLLLPAYIALLYALTETHGRSGWLSHPALFFLGEASYSLYLFHIPIALLLGLFIALDCPLAYVTYLASAVVASCLIFWFIERPCRRAILRHGRRRLSCTEP